MEKISTIPEWGSWWFAVAMSCNPTSKLKKINSVISTNDKILFKKPSSFAKPIAQIKKGRLLILQKCEQNWCNIQTDKFSGWIDKTNIWGEIN